MSISQRLALMFALVSLIILGGIGLFLYSSLERELVWRDDQTLKGRLERMESLLATAGTVSELQSQPQLYANMLGNTDNVLWVLNDEGEVLIEINPPGLPVPGKAQSSSVVFSSGETPVDYRLASYSTRIGDRPLTLVAGRTLTERNGMLAYYQATLGWALIIGALSSGLIGWHISQRGLRPVRELSDDVNRIRISNLDTRLRPRNRYPELSQLTGRLNEMIARLETGFTKLTQFSEDLAHEMRTPLNNLMGQTQHCLSKPRESTEYEELLLSNLEEYERLSRMINSLLFLARAEQTSEDIQREPVLVHSMVAQVFDYFSDLAEEKAVTLNNEANGQLHAAPDLVQRALVNLIDNALNHTRAHGSITVRTHHADTESVLTVFNTGEPIETHHLDRIFDRFYRCDPARQNASQTGGLGLSIVASIMKSHGGAAEIGNVSGGVEVRLVIPDVSPDATAT
ncbi:heavy metal sensor histidine kinase [Marinobacter hydrocarbonoclasticus]|uniref:heavy metal sensor histidine kinase n=1 Tax=Marinobacter nauticus TaxID=2743 RepID=UPI001C960472|nr:heavy metal sensor histidine kinase [Marinobacter nauticus]MBY6192340.1 heavy metal sensor histidine kinase [Marinobacter nauticus]MBY6213488.1 heavy metal sensor histidine kinase [Marinobacter nauticus]